MIETTILTPKHKAYGLELYEFEDFLVLRERDIIIARFSTYGAKPDKIIEVADKWIKSEENHYS